VFVPFLAGQDLTDSLLTAGVDNAYQVEGLTADLTVSSTTFQNSSDLTLPLTVNASYIMQCQFVYDSNATADIQIRFTTPVGTIIRLAAWGPGTAQSGTTAISVPVNVTDSTTTATVSYGGGGAGTFLMAAPRGALISVGGAGNLVIGFAQVSASGSTILKVGSMVALSRFF
jgi:hypothetical protein